MYKGKCYTYPLWRNFKVNPISRIQSACYTTLENRATASYSLASHTTPGPKSESQIKHQNCQESESRIEVLNFLPLKASLGTRET